MNSLTRLFKVSAVMAPLLLVPGAILSQLPSGSIAPDWTATDIDGVEHNLYDLLDEGKKVILQFSATWCGPCWNYHNSGALAEIWETYGPDGTDEVYVFFLEADDTTTQQDLEGTGPATQGNWINETAYPIIDNAGNIFDDYAGAYYPTIYTVCPNRILTESGQITAADHAEILFANGCAAATLPSDVAILDFTGSLIGCVGEPTAISAMMMNLGTEPLTSTTLGMYINGILVGSTNWTGNLGTYGMAEVHLPPYAFSGDASYTIEVIGGDMNGSNDVLEVEFSAGVPSTQVIRIQIGTDGWGEETGWTITDAEGNIVEELLTGSLANTSEYTWDVLLPADGCYQFSITDAYGDGIFGSQWGSIDGYCEVTSHTSYPVNEAVPPLSVIYSYQGNYDFVEEATNFEASEDFDGNILFGCTDPSAINYNPESIYDDGSCIETVGCFEIGQAFWAELVPFGVFPEEANGFLGDINWYTPDSSLIVGWVLNVPQMLTDPGNGGEYNVHSFAIQDVSGFPEGVTWSLEEDSLLGGEQTCLNVSGYPFETGTYVIEVIGDMSISIFGAPFPIGLYTTTLTLDVLPNPNPIIGCTYPGASNFNLVANQDDFSCIFPGCMDESALNFHPMFNEDNGSCIYPDDLGVGASCPSDLNGDGLIAIGDLLMLLGEFGIPCPD